MNRRSFLKKLSTTAVAAPLLAKDVAKDLFEEQLMEEPQVESVDEPAKPEQALPTYQFFASPCFMGTGASSSASLLLFRTDFEGAPIGTLEQWPPDA